MLPTHDVPCPPPESPPLQRDAVGEYTACPHCRERVAMKTIRRGDAAEVQVWKGQS